MKQLVIALLSLLCAASIVSCNDYETYGDKKEKERDDIKNFIANQSIQVISESQFHAQGDVTNVDNHEFVYLDNNGVYMQIVEKGCGTPLQDGESNTLLVRFAEVCLRDSTIIKNNASPYEPDYMSIQRSGNTFTASFTKGLWYSTYGSSYSSSAQVPAGLLAPLLYINVGRPQSAGDKLAKVRLIVPHSQGHTIASSYVYPYYYELTFQRLIDFNYDTH